MVAVARCEDSFEVPDSFLLLPILGSAHTEIELGDRGFVTPGVTRNDVLHCLINRLIFLLDRGEGADEGVAGPHLGLVGAQCLPQRRLSLMMLPLEVPVDTRGDDHQRQGHGADDA